MVNFSVRIAREVVVADKLMLQAAEELKSTDATADTSAKEVHQDFDWTKFGLGIIDAYYNPVPGEDFQYNNPAGRAINGLPLNDIGSITLRDAQGNTVASMSGLHLTFSELAHLNTQAKFNAFIFSGRDLIDGGSEKDLLHGYGGNDTVSGGGGTDILYGDDGKDVLNGDAGRDRLYGGAKADTLFGGDDRDILVGGGGNDQLNGGNDGDTLSGGAGNDQINGGLGADVLTGGAGRDVFVYRALPQAHESGPNPSQRDLITDFHHGDKVDISFISSEPFEFIDTADFSAADQVRYHSVGKNTLIEVSTDSDPAAEISILLKGHITLGAGDFVL